MTSGELGSKFNRDFGLRAWPSVFEVDSETYSNVCQDIFDARSREVNGHVIQISLGRHCGIMFKGVELLLKRND